MSVQDVIRTTEGKHALALLGHYLIISSQGEITRRRILEEASGDALDKRALDNLLAGSSTTGAGQFYEFVKKIVTKRGYFEKSPHHIRELIRRCFDIETTNSSMIREYSDIISILSEETTIAAERMVSKFCGIWNIVRYSAHVDTGAISDVIAGGRLNDGSVNAWVVRTSIEITPQNDGENPLMPKFTLRYKPRNITDYNDYIQTDGVMMSIGSGEAAIMTGLEGDSNFPVSIICRQSDAISRTFPGIVRRKHEQGQIFVARVVFIKSDSHSLDELNSKIGVTTEKNLIKDLEEEYNNELNVERILQLMKNNVPFDGKSTLIL